MTPERRRTLARTLAALLRQPQPLTGPDLLLARVIAVALAPPEGWDIMATPSAPPVLH